MRTKVFPSDIYKDHPRERFMAALATAVVYKRDPLFRTLLDFYKRTAASVGVDVVDAKELLSKHDLRFIDDIPDENIDLDCAIRNLEMLGLVKGQEFPVDSYLHAYSFLCDLKEYRSIPDCSALDIFQWYKNVHYG